MYNLIFILISLVGSYNNTTHPIHISQCEVNHDDESKTLQVTLHLFVDDLEMAIEEAGLGKELKLGTEWEKAAADSVISLYLEKHLEMKIGEEGINLQFLGKELSRDYMAFWCFLESDPIDVIDGMEVRYDALMELYGDQKNIFNLNSGEQEIYHLFRSEGQYFKIN